MGRTARLERRKQAQTTAAQGSTLARDSLVANLPSLRPREPIKCSHLAIINFEAVRNVADKDFHHCEVSEERK